MSLIVRKKRESNRLDPLTIKSLMATPKAGRHADGGGLYLVVEPNGSARWSFIFRWRDGAGHKGPGRLREMGLGSARTVSLRRARERATDARELLSDGKDPIAARKAAEGIPTFGELADELVANKSAETTSKATIARLKRSLEAYAEPLRGMRIDQVDTTAVLDVLKPIWLEKQETAQKTRGLIEAVLNAGKAKGHRTGENPAQWRGHLDHLLPRLGKRERSHHPSMNRGDLPAFVCALRAREGVAPRALEFLILTAARVSEVTGADWRELDIENAMWTIPASRMKSRRIHRVALSERALKIVQGMCPDTARDGPVFPGTSKGGLLSNAAFERLLERMKVDGVTPHGFRSTFRDWVGEVSDYPTDLAEVALAHVRGDATERAYARGDALAKRSAMMQDWAKFVGG
jgi:integrase